MFEIVTKGFAPFPRIQLGSRRRSAVCMEVSAPASMDGKIPPGVLPPLDIQIARSSSADSFASSSGASSPGRRRTCSSGFPSYAVDLYQAFPQVCKKAKSGVQLCHAVAAVLAERAAMEHAYANALLRTAQNAGAEDWSEHLSRCWAEMLNQIEQLSNERAAFASTLHSSVVPGVKAFAAQHESQVQRLISEGTKVRLAHQQMLVSTEKAKERYDRKCQEAAEVAMAMRKMDTSESSAASNSASSSPAAAMPANIVDSSQGEMSSKELSDKISAGAGQLLTKMWDTTSSFRSPVSRQRSKLDSCLEDVIIAEKHYVQAVEVMNAQRPIFEREIKENLHAFQLTEEQRLEYLKDVLLRTQKAFVKIFPRSTEIVDQMRTCVAEIDELADIEKAFQHLGPQVEVDVDSSDLSNNPFYNRVLHIQGLSESGHRTIGVISGTIMELTVIEDRRAQQLRKLSRIYDHGGNATGSATELFGSPSSASSPGTKFIHGEGESMAAGWKTIKDEIQLLLEVHQEFRSLLSEPVALSLETMKTEYESTGAAAQENFVKVHSSLCFESAAHLKLRQRLRGKLRDFSTALVSLQDGKVDEMTASVAEAMDSLKAVRELSGTFSERERRTEQKLRQLVGEMKQLEPVLNASLATLKDKYHLYVQDIEIFISTYMKNEKFRLQVAKSSLQSFAKALKHMLIGSSTLATQSLEAFDRIDPNTDISAFITDYRKPYQRSKRIVPAYHSNDALREALNEYHQFPKAQSSGAQPKDDAGDKAASPSANNHSNVRPAHPTDGTLNTHAASHTPRESEHGASEDSADDEYGDLEDSETDVQPLGVSDFQKKFKLSSPEQVVESYSCALYLSSFPYHGRMYLTRDHLCFAGWRDTIFVTSHSKIKSMEKKNTALIVPNAIELIVDGERVFFASFVFRDECFQCIQQLRAIKIGTDEILSGKAQEESGSSEATSMTPPPSTDIDVSATSAPQPASIQEDNTDTTVSVPDEDPLLREFEVVFDDEMPFSVQDAYSKFWVESNAFALELLEAASATNVKIGEWDNSPTTYTAVDTPETFDGSRTISHNHNKKYVVGPSTIPTTQLQRYKWTSGSRLVVAVTTTITNVPYSDYFRVEHRWVFSATAKRRVCRAQVGIRVQWIKSTWLKKQIEGTTVSESKDSVKTWFDAASAAVQRARAPSEAATGSAGNEGRASADESAAKNRPSRAASANADTTATAAAPWPFQSVVQMLALVCAVLFLYALLRVCVALEQMQSLTREMLQQQQQQQEFFREILSKMRQLDG